MRWKYVKRRLHGKLVKAKVHKKLDGTYLVRKVGHRNYRD